MILLLISCSSSWCQNNVEDSIFSTNNDSILVAIKDLRIATAKMVELKYEKEINKNLRGIIQTDSLVIDALHTNLAACELNTENKIAEIKKQRNIAIGAGSGSSLLFLILFIIAL